MPKHAFRRAGFGIAPWPVAGSKQTDTSIAMVGTNLNFICFFFETENIYGRVKVWSLVLVRANQVRRLSQ